MELGEFKPLLKALVLPPTGLLLLAAIGLALSRARRRAGTALVALSLALLWLLGSNSFAVLLSDAVLPGYPPIGARELAGTQAIVVLGGGTRPDSPEYGTAQPNGPTLQRIRYAATLARQSGKPLAFASGTGWGGRGPSEAEVAQRVFAQDYGLALRWSEGRSRDTRQNATEAAALLLKDGVRRIALVTDATHMPRALRNFREAGFDVVPAPMAYITSGGRLVDWLPSVDGLANSVYVLHEWLGLRLT